MTDPNPPLAEPMPMAIPLAGSSPAAPVRGQSPATVAAPPPVEQEQAPLVDLGPVVRESPPWLISAVLHMLVLICFGLLFAHSTDDVRLTLNATYAEDLGEQLLEENLELAPDSQFDLEEQVITPDELPEVEDPLATPALADPMPNPTESASDFVPQMIGMALSGRRPGNKEALLKAYGGNAVTEAAVTLGLKWLKRQQRKNGLWSLMGPYEDGAGVENLDAATAMALLAFQGAGHTHLGDRQNPFQPVVAKAWKALLRRQDDSGNFFQQGPDHHRFYTHAQCTIALCELFGMSGDEELRWPAQAAVDYLVQTQTPQGGWRYHPGQDNDLSVTGWVVMALQSARMAGLEVPSETFERVSEFLDRVAKYDGERYAYRPRDGATPAMTAEGLLCRQYLGWQHDEPRLELGCDYLLEHLPVYERNKRNVYYWYYATQVCHHMEGHWWQEWNARMRQILPANQERRGRERGSWDPRGDRRGTSGGRLYVTCLSIYMLEVYYRHLPIYQKGLVHGAL